MNQFPIKQAIEMPKPLDYHFQNQIQYGHLEKLLLFRWTSFLKFSSRHDMSGLRF